MPPSLDVDVAVMLPPARLRHASACFADCRVSPTETGVYTRITGCSFDIFSFTSRSADWLSLISLLPRHAEPDAEGI